MSTVATADPNERDAAGVAAEMFGRAVESVARFPAGRHHFVYDVTLVGGRRAVVRLSRADQIEAARGAVYWSARLRPEGVPLPVLLRADLTMTRHAFPVLVLERLPGDDLGQVYRDLAPADLTALARRLAAVQAIVTALPSGSGYGYARSYEGPFPHRAWGGVIAASLARSRARIRAAGIVEERLADTVERAAERLAGYFAGIAPTPFLHDITTKNVIVHARRLAGIVDVDDICFGDPLLLVALIRVALLAHDLDPAYVAAWIDIARPDAAAIAALDLYTALFCLDFLGECGQRFNRAAPDAVDPAYVARLETLLSRFARRAGA